MVGALLLDLSKALDCIDHELLIAKFNAYGYCKDAHFMIYNYLSGRKGHTALGEKLLPVLHKVQPLCLFFLIYTLMITFSL